MGDRAEDFGNDLVGAAHQHARTHLYVLAREIAEVVERRAAHGGPRELDGRDERERRQLSRAAHLPDHAFDRRLRFLRLELVGDRPARELIRIAHQAARRLGIRLDDGAVREHVERFSAHFDLVHRRTHLVKRAAHPEIGKGLKPPFPQSGNRLLLRGDRRVAHIVDIVEDDLGAAGGRHLRVEIADRPRRRVACVFERLVGVGAVIFFQHGQADHRLAAHFQRAAIGNGERKTAHGECLCGDVLPLGPVAARRRAHEAALLIGQAHGQAVELVFHRKNGRGIDFLHTRDKGGEFVLRDRLVERKERRNVPVARERLDGFAAHPARGRIGKARARLPFKLFQLVIQGIVLSVRNARRVLHVVLVCPLVERIHKIAHSVHSCSPVCETQTQSFP